MILLYRGQPYSEIESMPVSDVAAFLDALPLLATIDTNLSLTHG